ncbi:GDSL-type esterase/lipase family protein [Paenibacillus humicola]|uniref:GDSL-type esterase/lipase family protein n=1 Tax=Paenibacillus humicola TaxID=3110540 RepID=UPI00237A34C2|nr:GDSL-type esterase/lipase family protein [Paenibacillus humicola]
MRVERSNGLWKTIGLAALASTLLLIFGFGYAVKDMLWPKAEAFEGQPAQTAPPAAAGLANASEIRVTAIGDSLTKGTGDETGDGYVKQVIAMLQKKWPSVPVKLNNNLGINGLRADQLAKLLQSDKGFRYSVSQANLILFTIGGNDLFQIATGTSASEATGEVDLNKLKKELPQGIDRLKQVLKTLHELNPNAQVVYVGLYNPFYDVKELRPGSIEVQKWNEQAYEAVHQYANMTIVPTFDLFEKTIGTYLSSDHFHPNHVGYEQIAERIVQSLN